MKYVLSICLLATIIFGEMNAISLVYNLRVRRSFNIGLLSGQKKTSAFIVSAVPIVNVRDRHIVEKDLGVDICEERIIGGSLFNVRYVPSKVCWLELTTGVEKEQVESRGTSSLNTSRVGCDDIVLSAGYNFFPSQETQVGIYGLAGFPTTRQVTLDDIQDPLVGTRLFSAGFGAELSHAFTMKPEYSFVGVLQTRFLHFFTRQWFPVLPCDSQLKPGNVTDILCNLQFRKNVTVYEVGYNPTFFTNRGIIAKNIFVKGEDFVNNGVYVRMSHLCNKIQLFDTPLVLGTGINFSWTRRYDTQSIIWWLTMTLVF